MVEHGQAPGASAANARAARHIARERQKAELRRERDRMLVSIGEQLGSDGLAQQLGASRSAAETMIARARERLAEAGPNLTARRMPPDPDRWADADSRYEQLGREATPRAPRFPPRPV
jgi:hypothetical protein